MERKKGGGKEKRKRGKDWSGWKEEGQTEGKDLTGDQNTGSMTLSHTQSVDPENRSMARVPSKIILS